MDISSNDIIKIFENNFKCDVVETEIGRGFKINPYEAFIFCSVTGSGYLNNPIMPFTPKGLLKIFYNNTMFKNIILNTLKEFNNIKKQNISIIFTKDKSFFLKKGNI